MSFTEQFTSALCTIAPEEVLTANFCQTHSGFRRYHKTEFLKNGQRRRRALEIHRVHRFPVLSDGWHNIAIFGTLPH